MAYTFVAGDREVGWTYRQLDERARVIGANLQQKRTQRGDRVVLAMPPSLEYVAAFMGCLYAGAIAVPVYPPAGSGTARSSRRLEAVMADATPATVLTSTHVTSCETLASRGSSPRWLCTESFDSQVAAGWEPAAPGPEDVAFLQYTSGSTAAPKGVMVSHGNLLHNAADIATFFEFDESSTMVSWLPPYHDMGLIGGILAPLYTGFPAVLMAPMEFVRNPARWLHVISRHGATVSGGPSFAYELCARKVTPDQVAELDISTWRTAFNGAEPVRADVMTRFANLMAPAGFQPSFFFPCYGLAEATLIVTGGAVGRPPTVREFAPHRSGHGLVAGAAIELVDCGAPSAAQRLVIVDPERHTVCAAGDLGEVWIAGPSVAQGYWGKPAETAETFGATAANGDGPFLRTGDLGIVHDGGLFVAGRLKDMIIRRGLNYLPQDIEAAAAQSHPGLRPGGAAAFTVELGGRERLVVVQEVARGRITDDLAGAAEALRAHVYADQALAVDALVLIRPGSLPRTSSGKVQRHATRERYLRGELSALFTQAYDETAEESLPADAGQDQTALADTVLAFLVRVVARRTGRDPASVDIHLDGPSLGLDSVALLEALHDLEAEYGFELEADHVYGLSLAEIGANAVLAIRDGRISRELPGSEVDRPSHGQTALWLLNQMADPGAAYHLQCAFRPPVDVDVEALDRAVRAVIARHDSLRSTFVVQDGMPTRALKPAADFGLDVRELIDFSEPNVQQVFAAAASEPFDLSTGPLLRTVLWTGAGERPLLLICVHHIVADFWSLGLLLTELIEYYKHGTPPTTAATPYAEFVGWQSAYLDSAEGAASLRYWTDQLGGELPVLDLPTDHPRPAVQTFRGAAIPVAVDPECARRLRAAAASHGTTVYAVLLAAYQVFLHRYTGQSDVLVASPATGRSHAKFAAAIGYFVNPVVMRARFDGNPTFRAMLDQTKRTVSDGLAHQGLPFGLLAEKLNAARDASRSPIFQTMFALQQPPGQMPDAFAQLAVGGSGMEIEIAGVSLESVAVPVSTAQFDLALSFAAEGPDSGLSGALQYNADLFTAGTAEEMGANFTLLLGNLLNDLDRPVRRVEMLSPRSRERVAGAVNSTAGPFDHDRCVHETFAAQASSRPDAVAVEVAGDRLTYRELDQRVDRLAVRLAGLNIRPESRVGLYMDRSVEMVVAMLAIMRAGGAYVPLEPGYPGDRLAMIIEEADIALIVTRAHLRDRLPATPCVTLDIESVQDLSEVTRAPAAAIDPRGCAYVLYTSGSTGRPKGVQVTHRNLQNFFAGMDARVGCGPDDTLVAATGVGFDISVLELLWTLCRGARVVVLDDILRAPATPGPPARGLELSLFYFGSATGATDADLYRLVMDGARFADRAGFTAVWTPERHFHEFGGLYPNPSVLSAAIAAATERIQIRAGSVVLPLHSPIRVAEEWSLVDNLSKGRVGVAFASGWHADDFVFFPERYQDRKAQMFRDIETVQALWQGKSVGAVGGAGNAVDVRIFPAPVQPVLPMWITAAGSPETFERAGAIGANVLTHLLGQTLHQVAANIARYRASRAAHGHDPASGTVTLMLHTFIGEDPDAVRELVREPFTEYLRTSVGLIENLVRSQQPTVDITALSEDDMRGLLDHAFDRYFETSALFGTPDTVQETLARVSACGVDEIACLIDFGLGTDDVLGGLPRLAEARRRHVASVRPATGSLASQIAGARPTLMQSTPSLMKLLLADDDIVAGLGTLRTLLVGGEAMSPALAEEILRRLPVRLQNMYGPTETTIWSSVHDVTTVGAAIPIGEPILNTTMYVVGPDLDLLPPGAVGELLIGGEGVARGYWRRPDLTADRFIPDSFGGSPGTRLYRTGDVARRRRDGAIEFLGRMDRQVKIRGHRIELGEIEYALSCLPTVREAAVVAIRHQPDDLQLVAYVVQAEAGGLDSVAISRELRKQLPQSMLPSRIVTLAALPLTANGKVDVRALPAPAVTVGAGRALTPSTDLERDIAAIWRDILGVDTVSMSDNFFDLGGHSLLMVQVHARIKQLVDRDLPLVRLLEHPTVAAIAAHLSDAAPAGGLAASRERARRQRDSRRGHLPTTRKSDQ